MPFETEPAASPIATPVATSDNTGDNDDGGKSRILFFSVLGVWTPGDASYNDMPLATVTLHSGTMHANLVAR